MRKIYHPLLRRAEYFERHGNIRVFNCPRSFDLHENEGIIGETKENCNENSAEEQSGNGVVFLLGLHPRRLSQMGKILNVQSETHRNPKTHDVQIGFYRGLVTGRKVNTVEKVEKTFEAASTVEELKTAFRAMEAVFDSDDKRLGMASLRMGQQFGLAGEDPQTILFYAERALGILEKHDKNSVEVAMSLHLLGSLHYAYTTFDESLGYLNRANNILEKLENEGNPIQIKPIGFAVQVLLGDVKMAMGRREDALSNYTKSLKLKEEVLEPDDPHMAVANRQVAEAFVAVLNFKDALPLCLKALDMHRLQLGENSVEVATDRRLLAVIYGGLGEDKKALEENEAAKKVLKNWGMNKELIYAELDSANVQISVGKYDDAINTLREVIQHTDKESELRATILLYMAKALCNLEKYDDSKKFCGLATNLFKKYEQTNPRKVGEAYTELAMMYQTMNDFEAAISLYKKALGIYEKSPQERHAEASAKGRLGYLLLLTGSVSEAISNLESSALILKESFGPHHFGVGYIYNNLGAAYEELERPQTAAQMFLMAREIMEIALGPQHMDTIDTIQNLANVHGSMGKLVDCSLSSFICISE
ncbi:hypothetical protein KI387_004462 [Taxus chinensis]|uniref:Tetratricopeptide SHNi-TPR domain-containing protein n=1 Tax=Taxus chinensis TaxID=29808 RepID=A0AA38GLN8_TAXCH|nr:hypothetical protein KI387_004462 [Taxus chinensis]